ALIPLASLAGILVVVAYHMSEWKTFVSLLRGPRSDMMVLLTTFLLTVLVDLTVAIEIGMLLAILLFMRSVIQVSGARPFAKPASEDNDITAMPEGVNVFEITGPLFFGAAHKFKRTLQIIDK